MVSSQVGGGLQARMDSNGSLILRPLTKEAHGRWECSAGNTVARVAASTTIYVLGLYLQDRACPSTGVDGELAVLGSLL